MEGAEKLNTTKIDASFYDQKYYQERGHVFQKQYPIYRKLAENLKERFNPETVLDVGCGIGTLVKAFRDLGIEGWGIDCSEYALSQAPMDIKAHVLMVDIDKEELPFDDEKFDLITILEVLEHLYNHRHLISEVKRVLRNSGIAFVTTPFDVNPKEPAHINIRPRKFWIKEFESFGFKYLKGPAYISPPVTGAGKFLSEMSIFGKWTLLLARRFLGFVGITYAPLIFVK